MSFIIELDSNKFVSVLYAQGYTHNSTDKIANIDNLIILLASMNLHNTVKNNILNVMERTVFNSKVIDIERVVQMPGIYNWADINYDNPHPSAIAAEDAYRKIGLTDLDIDDKNFLAKVVEDILLSDEATL